MRTLTVFLCLTLAVLLFSAGEGFALPPCPGSYNQNTWHNCFGTVSADGKNLSVNSGMINPADGTPTPFWLTANMSVDGRKERGTDRTTKPLPMWVKRAGYSAYRRPVIATPHIDSTAYRVIVPRRGCKSPHTHEFWN